jgi:hypothetical protein
VPFVARRRAYFSSSGSFGVVEGDEHRVEIAVLVSGSDEVALGVVVDWPKRVVVVQAWMQLCGLTEVERLRGEREGAGGDEHT